jgi:hypothetical protein
VTNFQKDLILVLDNVSWRTVNKNTFCS